MVWTRVRIVEVQTILLHKWDSNPKSQRTKPQVRNLLMPFWSNSFRIPTWNAGCCNSLKHNECPNLEPPLLELQPDPPVFQRDRTHVRPTHSLPGGPCTRKPGMFVIFRATWKQASKHLEQTGGIIIPVNAEHPWEPCTGVLRNTICKRLCTVRFCCGNKWTPQPHWLNSTTRVHFHSCYKLVGNSAPHSDSGTPVNGGSTALQFSIWSLQPPSSLIHRAVEGRELEDCAATLKCSGKKCHPHFYLQPVPELLMWPVELQVIWEYESGVHAYSGTSNVSSVVFLDV